MVGPLRAASDVPLAAVTRGRRPPPQRRRSGAALMLQTWCFLGGWCFSRVADPADVIAWDNEIDGFCCLSWESAMTLGLAPKQADLLHTTVSYCEPRIGADSIYAVLHRECFTLFPDEMFADLFTDVGRRSVPPMIVAVVMVLQRIDGCSDREAVDRFAFDARWKYAAGGLAFDYPGFVHTVLVDMRARLAASGRPDRIFEVTLAAAKGLFTIEGVVVVGVSVAG